MKCEICRNEPVLDDVLCADCRDAVMRLATICAAHPELSASPRTTSYVVRQSAMAGAKA